MWQQVWKNIFFYHYIIICEQNITSVTKAKFERYIFSASNLSFEFQNRLSLLTMATLLISGFQHF